MNSNKKITQPLFYNSADSVDSRLKQLGTGLSAHTIRSAAATALAHAAQTTANNAKNAYGTYLYQGLVRCLREQLRPFDWGKDSSHHREAVVSPDKGVLIIVMSGTKGLGIHNPPNLPTNKNPKGPKFVQDMVRQATDFEILPLFDDIPNNQYWVLLHCHEDGELKMELVRPSQMSSDNKYMAGYYERLYIGAIPLDGDTDLGMVTPNTPPNSPPPEIVIKRKV